MSALALYAEARNVICKSCMGVLFFFFIRYREIYCGGMRVWTTAGALAEEVLKKRDFLERPERAAV